jgi:hypothetical protein
LVSVLGGVEDASPLLEEGVSVLRVPLEAAEVRPEVLCAAELELELLAP